MNSRHRFSLFALQLGVWGSALLSAAAQTPDPSLYSGLVWRNIGPFRGGRVSAVSGAVGQPGVFYMGLPAGGVWKTTSAGTTWFPIFDSIKEASSVGAVEVAPSDPNVIYVGMGDMVTGGAINEGNGVYKSIDAGKTWIHLGLEQTKQIPSILVDPHNPNIVLVAAQGNIHEKSDQWGLFRSTDGGKTWKKTLYVDDQTGVQKITWAYDNPKVMLATTVRHYNAPGAQGRGGFGGQPGGTFLFKSIDEGLTWKKLTDVSLPDLAGKTCVAIANNTNSKRMFLVGNFGLYRSDDAGSTWQQMDPEDRRVMNGQGGYNCGVYVNSKNPDIVYVINTSSYISRNGGNTFTGFKGAPGGDDPQQMWIDPTDGNRLFLGTDQGATVSLDGGANWSSWYNQPTAQVYHISTDNRWPYWVYATQQDSGSIATASRGNLGAITPMDWLPHPGYEFGSIVADPRDPNISYAGGPGGGLVKVTYPSGQWINVSPNINAKEALRKVGNQPLGFSPANPKELLIGFQYLMATTDGGVHWKKLSPDLGYPKGVTPPTPGAARPATPGARPPAGSSQIEEADDDDDDMDPDAIIDQQPGPGVGGSIESFSVSSVNGNVIWVGTNNGLVKVTKDHGATWEDVTIPHLPNPTRADISSIDASHQQAGTAFATIDYHTSGDYQPYVYRTADFGQTWTKIVGGLPTDLVGGSFARVVRSDTVRDGLIFLGTESSVYVSFDSGDHWQSLALNAPTTSNRDMVVKGKDLVVGTYGRSFWILDDISPLRQVKTSTLGEDAVLYKPGEAVRVRRNVNGDTPFPPEIPHAINPPTGAILYYYLKSAPAAPIKLEIADSKGRIVRTYSSAPLPPSNDSPPPVPDFWIEKLKPLPASPGMWRVSWNLRYENPPSNNHSYEINANPGETNASPEGPLVLPGTYTAILTVDGKAMRQSFVVKNDPRSPASFGDLKAQHDLQIRLYDGALTALAKGREVSALRTSIAAAAKGSKVEAVTKAVAAADAKLLAIVGAAPAGGRRGGGGGGFRGGGPAGPPTLTSLSGSLVRELSTLDPGDMAPNEPQLKSANASLDSLTTLLNAWKEFLNKDLRELNALFAKNNLPTTGKPSKERSTPYGSAP